MTRFDFLKRVGSGAWCVVLLCSAVFAEENLSIPPQDTVISAPAPRQETIAPPPQKPAVIQEPKGLTIQDLTGEVISYSIKEGILRIGSAKMMFEGLVKNDDEESVLIHVTWGIPGFSSDERIYLDPETFYPKFVYKERMKFGCKIRVVEDYFPDEGRVSIYRDTCGNIEQRLADRGAPVESIYARIYRLRMMGGSLDEIQPFVVRMPDKDENFKLEGTKKLNYARQEHEARHFASETFGIWMEPGPERLPLRIDSAEEHSVTMVMKKRKISADPEAETDEDSDDSADQTAHLPGESVAHAAQGGN